MSDARIWCESTISDGQQATEWVLQCPHGRFTFLVLPGGYPGNEGTVVRMHLLPQHDNHHDRFCTAALRKHDMPGGKGWTGDTLRYQRARS